MANDRTALVCSGDDSLRKAVASAGWTILESGESADALTLLREDAARLVALDSAAPPDIRAFLASLAGPRRRALFVIVAGENFTSGDRIQAWSESADLVLATGDLARLAALLDDATAEKERFYQVFEEVRRWSDYRLGAHA